MHGVRGLVGRLGGLNAGGNVLETISDIMRDETPVRRLGALGGPTLASDLLAGSPSVMILRLALSRGATKRRRQVFASPRLAASTRRTTCSAWNGRALSLAAWPSLWGTRGASGPARGSWPPSSPERSRKRPGSQRQPVAQERTLLGLAGYGDLLASIEQRERPEVLLGHALAHRAKSLQDVRSCRCTSASRP